ncbi:hypothetical protein HD554DRAFT_1080823 [Boletus coccyginus]|nr:hypothetical protein HD554DRAFT_1080823 [Boletus coccyginus]
MHRMNSIVREAVVFNTYIYIAGCLQYLGWVRRTLGPVLPRRTSECSPLTHDTRALMMRQLWPPSLQSMIRVGPHLSSNLNLNSCQTPLRRLAYDFVYRKHRLLLSTSPKKASPRAHVSVPEWATRNITRALPQASPPPPCHSVHHGTRGSSRTGGGAIVRYMTFCAKYAPPGKHLHPWRLGLRQGQLWAEVSKQALMSGIP